MKPIYLLATLFLLTLAFTGKAQPKTQDTGYFNNADQPTSRQFATYYQVVVHTDSGWTYAEHWMNDHLKITGTIAEDMKTRVGTFAWYDTAGLLKMRRRYVGHGGAVETVYYPTGEIMLQGPRLNEQRMGDWAGYYPSGKVKAIATYSNDRLDTARFFNEDGSPNDSMKIFMRNADYPGGDEAWLQFLGKNLLAGSAANNGRRGTVIVQFKVSKEGKTSDFIILQSAGKSMNDEAIAVIKKSGDWLPAIYGGTTIDTYKQQPVVFGSENPPPSDTGNEDYDKIFTKVEIESEFPGGASAWLRFLTRNLQYPSEAVNYRVQGTVIVQFVVDKQGHISNVQAISGPEMGGLREEAVRVIRKSGIWTPAIQNGIQVKSYKKQPIVFKLEGF